MHAGLSGVQQQPSSGGCLPDAPAGLDDWLLGCDGVRACVAALAPWPAGGLALVTGAGGLFDGAAGDGAEGGSAAQLASWLGAPLVLVVDASAVSSARTVVALLRGCAGEARVAGLLLNKLPPGRPGLSVDAMQQSLDAAGLDVAVLGALPKVHACCHCVSV